MAEFKKSLAMVPCSLVLSMAVACGSSGPDASEQKIYGGTPVAARAWKNVVAVTQRGRLFCSGTAIAPRLVITAAHCITEFKASAIKVYVGNGREGGRVPAQHQARTITYFPAYEVDNDIAYIVLSKDLNLDKKDYIPVLTDADEIDELLRIGGIGHIVGFGNRENGGFGVKYEVEGEIRELTHNEVTIGGDGKDSCQNDSGGPVFGRLANGEWRVYGVTSRGDDCGKGGIYGLMHANICWVQRDSGIDLGLPAGTCEP